MKKTTFVLFAILLSAAQLSAESSPKKRYIVTMSGGGARTLAPIRFDVAESAVTDRLEKLDAIVVDLTEEQARRIRSRRGVRSVDADRPVRMFAQGKVIAPTRSTGVQSIPYGVALVRAPEVWPYATGAGIKIAVIDTGIDHTHPELRAAYRGGRDFANGDDDPMDDNGHGTHVAGTIAAANDSVGVVGVAPGVELYGLKVLDADGSGSLSNIIKALDWAIEKKMHVLNLSLGAQESSPSEEAAFQKVRDAGILTIAASGNCYDSCIEYPNGVKTNVSYPAGYPSVVAVGSIDRTSGIAGYSQRGLGLKVVAPGVGVLSTWPVGMIKIAEVVAGDLGFEAIPMEGSPQRNANGKIVYSKFGKPGEFPASVSGSIALIERGEITFAEKAKNAKLAGATGVVIYNRAGEEGSFSGTLINLENPTPLGYEFLPTVGIARADGEALKNQDGAELEIHFGVSSDFAQIGGTSMASPHAAGVAALIWSLNPTATAQEVEAVLLNGTYDIGDYGFDSVFGSGSIDARRAGWQLSPSSFPAAPPRGRGTRP